MQEATPEFWLAITALLIGFVNFLLFVKLLDTLQKRFERVINSLTGVVKLYDSLDRVSGTQLKINEEIFGTLRHVDERFRLVWDTLEILRTPTKAPSAKDRLS
jgi:hypothetical protein